MRDSRIVWYFNFEVENKLEKNNDDIIKQFLLRRYVENISEDKKLVYLLSQNIQTNVAEIDKNIEVPQLWNKHELIRLCYKNIYEYAHTRYLNSLSSKWFYKTKYAQFTWNTMIFSH